MGGTGPDRPEGVVIPRGREPTGGTRNAADSGPEDGVFRPQSLTRKAARKKIECPPTHADVAELADAHGSGPCSRMGVEVQVLSSAPQNPVLSVVCCRC